MKQRRDILLCWIAVVIMVLVGCAAPAAPPAAEPAAPPAEEQVPAEEEPAEAPEEEPAEPPEEEPAEPPEVLRIAIASPFDVLDPALASPWSQGTSTVLRALYETLVTYNPDEPGEIVPGLAESWDVSEDGLEWVFFLRDDAVFANASVVLATDVEFSFNRLKELNGPAAFLAENIEYVEALDDRTVAIHLNQPDLATPAKLATEAFSVVSQAQVEAQGDDFLYSNSAGSGPYILEARSNDEVVLALNDNCYDEETSCPQFAEGMTKFYQVLVRHVPDSAMRATMLQAGEVDIALDVTAEDASLLDPELISIYDDPGAALVYLAANPQSEGIVQDYRVQAAIRHALDYDTFRDMMGGGAQTPASFIPRGFPEAITEGIEYDPDTAVALLQEAGYEGQEIRLLFHYSPEMVTLAEMMGVFLENVGITVTLELTDYSSFQARLQESDFDLALLGQGPTYLDAQDYLEFLPGGGIADLIGWQDEELEEYRNAALQVMDFDTRQDILLQAQEIVNERSPFAFVLQPGLVSATSLDITLSSRDQRGVMHLDNVRSSYCNRCRGGSCCRRCRC